MKKDYTNGGRKPMMCGGDSRKNRMSGSPQPRGEREQMNPKGATTMQDITGASKAQMATQRREEMMRMDVPTLRRIASEDKDPAERQTARSVLREKGDKGAMPQGDQQPAGMMYGGKAK